MRTLPEGAALALLQEVTTLVDEYLTDARTEHGPVRGAGARARQTPSGSNTITTTNTLPHYLTIHYGSFVKNIKYESSDLFLNHSCSPPS